MKLFGKRSWILVGLLAVSTGLVGLCASAEDDPARPGRPEGERDRGRPSSWDRLPEAKRERIREVLKQVFESEEVKLARGQMAEATENYKRVLREAIGEVDAEIKGDIERILRSKLESDMGGRGARFRGMMIPMERVPEEKRDELRALAMKFGELPEVRELRKRFAGESGKERGEEFMRMRVREWALFRAFIEKEAPEFVELVPEKPPLAGAGREGDRDRRRDEAGGDERRPGDR